MASKDSEKVLQDYLKIWGKGSLWGKKGDKKAASRARSARNIDLTTDLGEGNWADMMRRLGMGYEGQNLPSHFQNYAPLLFANLLKTDAAKDLMDPRKMTEMAYRPGAAAIASGTEQGLRGARGSLAMSGLSSSGAYPMLEAQMRMQSAGMQGNLYTNLMQQQMQNSYNMQRDVAGMGQGMAPQGGGGGSNSAAWVGPLAQAAGSFAGYYLGNSGGGGQRAPSAPQQQGKWV